MRFGNPLSRKDEVRSLRDPMVRKGGLEPPRAVPPEPKSGASTNSATFATPASRRARSRIIADPPAGSGAPRNAPRRILIMVRSSSTLRALHVSVDHYENFPVASLLVPARAAPRRRSRSTASPAQRTTSPTKATRPRPRGSRRSRRSTRARRDRARRDAARAAFPRAGGGRARGIACRSRPLRDLLSAFRQDVTTTRYARSRICSTTAGARPIRSAGCCSRCTSANRRTTSRPATRSAPALQLTNFWQDVAGDWQKGRVYLPLEDLARFGVTEAQIAAATLR